MEAIVGELTALIEEYRTDFYAWADSSGSEAYVDFPDSLSAFTWWIQNGKPCAQEAR